MANKKEYKYWSASPVNERASEKGYKWRYSGMINDEDVKRLKEYRIDDNSYPSFAQTFGIRIVRASTKEIIYEYINMNWLKNHKATYEQEEI